MLNEELLIRKLAQKKLNFPLKLVLWVRANMTNEVMAKIDYCQLEDIKWRLESGSISVRTKIEEALLKDHELEQEEDQFMAIDEVQEPKKEDHYISQYKKFSRIIYEFLKLISKIIISNTIVFCYLFMILAHIFNGTLLSLVYPISIFAYALLEETRPSK